jgi:hypothetical protein
MNVGPANDLGAEREIDLRKWRDALFARWWLAVAGLAAGIVVGALYGLSGGSAFNATALVVPGQAFGPNGNAVQTYLTSASAINTLATSNTTLTEAAAKAGIGIGQLRGHVSTAPIDLTTGATSSATSSRAAVLVQISVQLPKKKKAEDVANAIAEIVQRDGTSPYVVASINIINSELANFKARLVTEKVRVAAANAAVKQPGLSLTESLLLRDDADTALANLNQTQQEILTTQQQLYLARQVEETRILQHAKASKTTARSRRNSVAVGAVIGLIIGAIVAMIVGLRGPRRVAV